LAASFSSRKPGFNPRAVYVGFEVEEEIQGQGLSELFGFHFPNTLFYKSSIFIHLSSGTGKTRLEVAVPPRCILTELKL
jgi:hypothetical protein